MAHMDAAEALPALIILYGSHGRNVWPLERDIMTLGRAHGCDIRLDGPDVSSLHCVIARADHGLEGLHLRDCGSRSGTLRNGESIHETILQDGDVLQVGSFCFRVHVPARLTRDRTFEPRLRRLERSRRNLARLALAMRRRLRDAQLLLAPAAASFELNRKASGLRNFFLAFQQRLRLLEQAERELARDRELFDQERRQSEEHLARRGQDLRIPGSGLVHRPRQLEITP